MGKKRHKHYESNTFSEPSLSLHEALHSNKEMDKMYEKIRTDEHQLAYYNAIDTHRMVIVDEPSGTGKTTVAFLKGLEMLREGKVSKIVYVRFPSKRGEGLGFTTGDLKEKESKYMKPAYQVLADFGLTRELVEEMMNNDLLELITDSSERGMTRDNEYAIIDESQNAIDLPQLNLILSRFTDASKVLLIGHNQQRDNKNVLYTKHKLTAFQIYTIHYMKKKWTTKCKLVTNHRGELSRWSDEVYKTVNAIDTDVEPLDIEYLTTDLNL